MPAKIRLQRRGKKNKPFYHIIIADGRAPRDGKFIEKIGTYNPITNPAEIELDLDRAVYWLQVGAQPTDTVRSILSHKGAMYKKHLLGGVKKGAFTAEEAEVKFLAWMNEKTQKIQNKINDTIQAEKEDKKNRNEAETAIKEAREIKLAKKKASEIDPEATTETTPAEEGEVKTEETATEEVKTEETKAEETNAKVEEVKTEAKEEPKEEEKKEEPKAEEAKEAKEAKEETKAEEKKEEEKTAEPKAEETKAEEVKKEEKKEEAPEKKSD